MVALVSGQVGDEGSPRPDIDPGIRHGEPCSAINGTLDITTLASGGRITGTMFSGTAQAGGLLVRVGRPRRLSPRLTAVDAAQEPRFDVNRLRAGTDENARVAAALSDDVVAAPLPRPEDEIYEVMLRPSGPSHTVFQIDFGGIPTWAVASTTPVAEALPAAELCHAVLSEYGPASEPGVGGRISLDSPTFFGDGWHPPERAGTRQAFRWTGVTEAELIVPLDRSAARRLTIRASSAVPENTIGVRVNDAQFAERPIRPGVTSYEWRIEPESLRDGANRYSCSLCVWRVRDEAERVQTGDGWVSVLPESRSRRRVASNERRGPTARPTPAERTAG